MNGIPLCVQLRANMGGWRGANIAYIQFIMAMKALSSQYSANLLNAMHPVRHYAPATAANYYKRFYSKHRSISENGKNELVRINLFVSCFHLCETAT